MHTIKIYAANWCHDCKALLSFFEEKNIPYEVVYVEKNQNAIDELKKLCGGKKIVPTLELGGKVMINPSIDEVQNELMMH